MSRRARAVEPVLRLVLEPGVAGAVVAAGLRGAPGQHHGAVLSAPARRARAVVGGAPVHAPPVQARLVPDTLVDLVVAVLALEAGGALARVPADAVDALAVSAGRGGALVDVDLAPRPRRARHAHALQPGLYIYFIHKLFIYFYIENCNGINKNIFCSYDNIIVLKDLNFTYN